MKFYNFAQSLVRFIMGFAYKIRVVNKEKLPMDRGFILCSNHVTDIDPLYIGLGFKKQVFFMAKEELFKVPVLSFLIKKLGAFPVARGKGDQAAIEKAVSIVQNGGVLGIFPEGTRSKDGKFAKVKSGAVLVASKTGGDIVPVGINYGKRKFIRKEITVVYGDPIKNSSLNIVERTKTELKAANELLSNGIKELLEEQHR